VVGAGAEDLVAPGLALAGFEPLLPPHPAMAIADASTTVKKASGRPWAAAGPSDLVRRRRISIPRADPYDRRRRRRRRRCCGDAAGP
jgi:hypothetical protein